jgi:ParB/RepB/Spo0J family partition protein
MLSKIKVNENYRETIDQKSIDELAESIRVNGVIQPIMLNQIDLDTYHVVFGQRRLLAAKKAGLVSIPATVKENLTEDEILSLRLIENVQRKDVTPWEEAIAFKKLSKKMTVNEISARLGKSVSHISLRIALCELDEFWMNLLKSAKIELAAAILIARLPKVGQEKLRNSIVDGEVLKTKDIETLIRNKIMLILKDGGFSLENPFGACGISCLSCTKRTGGNELFPDIKDTDYCLDSECFTDKKKAHLDSILKAIYDKYPDIVQVTDGYRNVKVSDTEVILGHESFDNVDESRAEEEDVHRAVYVMGNYAGRMTYIRLKTFTQQQIETKPVVDRKEQMQINKVHKEARMICLDEIKNGFGNNNTKLLDYYIVESMSSALTKGWPFKDQIKWLQENFKFTAYTGNETDHSAREKWMHLNINSIPQPAMKLNIWLHFMATRDSISNENTVYKLAEYTGVPGNKESFFQMAQDRIEKAKSVGIDDKEQKKEEKPKKEKKKKEPKVDSKEEADSNPKSEQQQPEESNPEPVEEQLETEELEGQETEESKAIIEPEEMEELYDDEEEGFDIEQELEEGLEEGLEQELEEETEDTSDLRRLGHHHDY